MGYLFTCDSLDRQVNHRINRLIGVAVNFRGGEGWVSACHHCRVVPSDEDAQSLAKVTHHLVLVLAKVPRQLPPQPGNGLQAHLVPAAKGVNSQGEEGDGFGAAPRLVLAQLLLVGVGNSRVPLFRGSHHQGLLKWVDNRDVEGGVPALCPDGDEDISWPMLLNYQIHI